MTSSKLAGVAIGVVLLVIILMQVAVPIINDAQSLQGEKPTSEVIASPFTYDTPIQLGHTNIVENSEKVYNATYTAVSGTDYTMDYVNGTITVLSTGNLLNTTSYNIDYQYYYNYYTGTTLKMVQILLTMLLLGAVVMVYAKFIARWI